MDDGRATLELTTPRARYEPMTLALRGAHQVPNALTAVRLLEELSALDRALVPAAAIRTALEDVVWPGRLEVLSRAGQDVLIDGAHNPAGARALAAFITSTYGRRLPLVVGVMRDKHVDEILRALAPVASRFVFVAPPSPRATEPAELLARAAAIAADVPAEVSDSPLAGVDRAIRFGTPVVVAGSLYLAGAVRADLS
jgi:dihydrofolate synthase/folylpolyglutamate synthase